MLNWRVVSGVRHPKYWVTGTELESTLAGRNSRFCITSVRRYDADRNPTAEYLVRDAETVSDAEVREGVRPRVVFRSYDLDEVLRFVG